MTWKPLLNEDDRSSALRVTRELAAVLADPPPSWVPPGSTDAYVQLANVALGGGRAGIALLFGYLARLYPEESAYAAAARELIVQAASAAQSAVMGPTLYSGFAGIGFALCKLNEWGVVPCDPSTFEAIDEALLLYLDREQWRLQIDLIAGIGGLAVYCLERLPSPTAARCLELIVRHFEAAAEETAQGITWFTPPEVLPAEALRLTPHGYYNQGFAHGAPGFLTVLARIAAAGVDAGRAARLVERGVPQLLSTRLENGNFPYMTGPGVSVRPARLAWCYGAPAIATAVNHAGMLLDRADWREEAVRIAEWACDVPADQSGVEDAGLCHGAAGLAHMFNRLYQSTGHQRLADAARRWVSSALAYRREGEGVGGYRAYNPEPDGDRYLNEPGLILGSAGVAAMLAAATSDVDPDWDRMFLTSV